MKNKLILMALLLTCVFIGCEDDDYDAPNSLSDIGWYTSLLRAEEFNIGINDYISFSDLSQGTLDHTWTISQGSYFLEGPIKRNDTLYDQYITDTISLKSTNKTIHVLFKKSGLQEINLYNTFKDSVTFKGVKGITDVVLPSKRIEDRWVIDTTFVVDVYDTIVPAMRIEQHGVVVPHESILDTIYVEAGDNIQLFDLTTIGRPNTWSWKIGDQYSNGQESTMVLKKLGTFVGQFTASRTGQNIPGDFETYKIPAIFKVIPSSQPFIIAGKIKELKDETLQVPFNGEFTSFENKEQFFTVKVNDVVFPVASVSINSDDATILDLVLQDPIYRPDIITVTLEPDSGLESTDTRTPVPFTDSPVEMHNVNLWDDNIYGFEDNAESWITSDGPGGTYSTEQASKGSYSMKLTSDDGWSRISSENFPVVVEGGKTYTISWKVWVDPATTVNSFGPWFYFSGGNQQFWTSLKDVPRGEWVTMSRDYDVANTGPTYFAFRINKTSVLYLDEVHIVETEIRP
ncbi:hypothetical protein MPF19_04180 [Polaribacter sp. Z014]|uniref:hypothetical protein n=1 Tax=Polaribacter sp. Z014 TaxID=2927126 RepID=UPI0020220F11|nr:hypothetical protein [Polaribacter sp. Z014]MCL7762601.1 hypothetical protein [Polaribacter sp. Z014]